MSWRNIETFKKNPCLTTGRSQPVTDYLFQIVWRFSETLSFVDKRFHSVRQRWAQASPCLCSDRGGTCDPSSSDRGEHGDSRSQGCGARWWWKQDLNPVVWHRSVCICFQKGTGWRYSPWDRPVLPVLSSARTFYRVKGRFGLSMFLLSWWLKAHRLGWRVGNGPYSPEDLRLVILNNRIYTDDSKILSLP